MSDKYQDSNKIAIVHQSMKDKGVEVQFKKDLEDITKPLDKREWKQIGTYTGNGELQYFPKHGVPVYIDPAKEAFIYDCEGSGLSPERFRELYLGDFKPEKVPEGPLSIADICKNLSSYTKPFRGTGVVCNPSNFGYAKESLHGFEIIADPNVPVDKAYLIDREAMFQIPDYSLHGIPRGRGKSMLAGLARLALEELEESAVVFDSMTKIRKGEHIGMTRNLVKRDKKKEKAKKQSRKRNRK